MKAKYLTQLPTGMITSHRQNQILENERMNNPEYTDYDEDVQRTVKTKRTSEEKRKHEFLIECRELLREFKISYDYVDEDFLIEWEKDGYEYAVVIGYQEYPHEDDTVHVWTCDYEDNLFSSDNTLDCINYVYSQLR